MFTVCVIKEGNPGTGDTLRSFRSYPSAKQYAAQRAYDYQDGVAIHARRRLYGKRQPPVLRATSRGVRR